MMKEEHENICVTLSFTSEEAFRTWWYEGTDVLEVGCKMTPNKRATCLIDEMSDPYIDEEIKLFGAEKVKEAIMSIECERPDVCGTNDVGRHLCVSCKFRQRILEELGI